MRFDWIAAAVMVAAAGAGFAQTQTPAKVPQRIERAADLPRATHPVSGKLNAIAATDPQETAALHALFDRHWEAIAKRYPEWASARGDLRYNDQLTDASIEAMEAQDRQTAAWLAEAKAIRADRLSEQDRVSLRMFISEQQRYLEGKAFPGYRCMTIGALGGTQTELADLATNAPFSTRLQGEQLIARMRASPKWMDQSIACLRRSMSLGWVASKDIVARAVAQIDTQINGDVEAGPYFAPFKRAHKGIAAADQAALRTQARTVIESDVLPAMRKLRAFIVDEYGPRAPASGAMLNYPDGVKVYEMQVRSSTTTRLTAAQIHAVGLREMAAIRAEMASVMRQVKFEGSFEQFITYLNNDPKFFHKSPEALLDGYRALAKRIEPELPRLFAELPRAPYGVRAMPDHQGPDAAEYYDGPALDGTKPGWFNANTLGWRTRPTWRMATLTAHEAVPGHHLQIARAVELKALPAFRRSSGYVAFQEGWGVYAETLGRGIGLYDDPYDLFGHLQWRALRAARLVVDTGMHSMGWSRQQAIDYMVAQTGMDKGFLTSEVDRYVSWPGQALGYMIGALKIEELRDKAKLQLGTKFDLRRFHNAVIDQGALPLDVLEDVIGEWVEAERVR
ncbi:DUF885 domain-containing protein [Caenimonas koreensis]|uniref:DUF885 domain-containing protein n=1 Tax=Caenimonas koreensis TaxID=367474 RepID=UPI003785280C